MDINQLVYKSVGKKIRELREEKGVSQELLAKSVGVSRASLVNYESGKQPMSLAVLYRIALKLDVAVVTLLPPASDLQSQAEPDHLLNAADDLQDKEKEELKTFIRSLDEEVNNEGKAES